MSRDREDKLEKQLKDTKEQHSSEICKLINDTIKNDGIVYLTTDWHLFRKDKDDKRICHQRSDMETVINNMAKLNENDLLINMGDLVDGEFRGKEQLKELLSPIKCKQILIIGNNDLFDIPFYKSCGFLYAVQSFVWEDIIFSHMPQKDHDYNMNIHGHIHGYKQYWVPYKDMIDVAYLNGRKEPVPLDKVINALPKYSKVAVEVPKHFDESSMFESLFNIEDPYID